MNLPLPARAIVVWFFLLIGLLSLSLLGMTSYDYYQYKSSYDQLQANELDEAQGIIDKAQESAMELGSLIGERIAVSGANKAKIQSILSSVNYLASLDGLPAVQSVQYISAEDPSVQITRFGVQPNNEIIDFGRTDSIFLKSQTFTLYKVVQASQETLGDAEIEETQENLSYGANTIRDGVSLNHSKPIKPVVMPSEIAALENLQFCVRYPEGFPTTYFKVSYKNLLSKQLSFLTKLSTSK